jgi:hypothetical protein
MTLFYQTNSWSSQPQQQQEITKETIKLWQHLAEKKNWRITQLPNGYYQSEHKDINCNCNPDKDACCEKWIDVTRRETLEGAEQAIDGSVEHFKRKIAYLKGPTVVKTFK